MPSEFFDIKVERCPRQFRPGKKYKIGVVIELPAQYPNLITSSFKRMQQEKEVKEKVASLGLPADQISRISFTKLFTKDAPYPIAKMSIWQDVR